MNTNGNSRLIRELASKEFRDVYVREFIKGGLPFQVRALRKQRGWTQAELAERMGEKQQSGISRIENPDYGTLSLETLLQLASAFDVALSVRFESYGDLLAKTEDLSPTALAVPSFDEDKGLRGAGIGPVTSSATICERDSTSNEWVTTSEEGPETKCAFLQSESTTGDILGGASTSIALSSD